MGDRTAIEWSDATWNPTTGCDRVSPGCANCYALTLAPRLQDMATMVAAKKGQFPEPTAPYMRDGDPKTSGRGFGLMLHENRLDTPLRWKRPRRIFVNSMSDLFHPEVTDEFLDRVFAVMALAPQHIFQVLTKRPERMRDYMTGDRDIGLRRDARAWVEDAARNIDPLYVMDTWPLLNVWLGASVENARWRTRIDELREVPAAVRFLSCEPLLGPLVCPQCSGAGWDVETRSDEPDGASNPYPVQVPCWGKGFGETHDLDLKGIDWVIVGGESGVGAREMSEAWVRDIIRSAEAQGAAPFVKQMGRVWAEEHLGNTGHAGNPDEWPVDLRVREYPA